MGTERSTCSRSHPSPKAPRTIATASCAKSKGRPSCGASDQARFKKKSNGSPSSSSGYCSLLLLNVGLLQLVGHVERPSRPKILPCHRTRRRMLVEEIERWQSASLTARMPWPEALKMAARITQEAARGPGQQPVSPPPASRVAARRSPSWSCFSRFLRDLGAEVVVQLSDAAPGGFRVACQLGGPATSFAFSGAGGKAVSDNTWGARRIGGTRQSPRRRAGTTSCSRRFLPQMSDRSVRAVRGGRWHTPSAGRFGRLGRSFPPPICKALHSGPGPISEADSREPSGNSNVPAISRFPSRRGHRGDLAVTFLLCLAGHLHHPANPSSELRSADCKPPRGWSLRPAAQ